MTALSLAAFANSSAFAGQGQAAPAPRGMNSVDAFHDALSRQTGADNVAAVQPQPVSDASAAADPKAIHADDGLDASTVERERVRKSLGLEGAVEPPRPTTGDTILGGIQKLRSVFDDRTTHIGDLMKSNMVNTQALMSMQMEVAQYTVMVDVSSKLMGKASSSLDTLMKGQ